MSTQSGNQKKKAQRYQNTTKYTVRYNETYQKVSDNAPMDRLCSCCKNQIEWKIQYGKYKRPNDMSRCIKCQEKVIFKAYRKICDRCSDELEVCAKCDTPFDEDDQPEDEEKVDQVQLKAMEAFMEGLRERSKRTVLRRLKTEEIVWSKEKQCFVESKGGKQLDNLLFKQNHIDEEDEQLWDDCSEDDEGEEDDEDEDEDEDEEDEEEEIEVKKKQKQVKKKSKPQKQVQKQKQNKLEDDEEEISYEKNNNHDNQFNQKQKSSDSLEDEDDYFICRESVSDGSIDLDKWNRTQKNFKFYFNIKRYPNDEVNSDEEDDA